METTIFDEKTGHTNSAPLKFPRLKDGAIPTLMPKCPAYMSDDVLMTVAPEDATVLYEYSTTLVKSAYDVIHVALQQQWTLMLVIAAIVPEVSPPFSSDKQKRHCGLH